MADALQLAFGTVRHRRLRPWSNAFVYRAFFLRLKMNVDLPASIRFARLNLLGIEAPGLLSFRSADHGPGDRPALDWARQVLADASIKADGEIWLHAFPRVMGYTFKPVSFWFCHAQAGALVAVIAEVNNTFGERRAYLLHDEGRRLRQGADLLATKDFHVSPFCQPNGRYRFRFINRSDRCIARIDHEDHVGTLLQTSLSGAPTRATRANVIRAVLGYPLFTVSVIVRIHWQAWRLWRNGVPLVSKPAPPAHAMTHPAQGHPSIRSIPG